MIESILIYSRATPHHHTGGMETLAWSLAVEWARSVREVCVVTTVLPGTEAPFTEDGVRVVPLAGTRPGAYSAGWWEASRRYWSALAEAPGVVLSVSAGAYSVVRDRERHPGTPFVMQAHGTSTMEIGSKLRAANPRSLATTPKNALGLLRDAARYRDFDRIVAVGDNVVRSLAAAPLRWSVPAERVQLIHNGVRVEERAFDPAGRAEIRRALGIAEATAVVACVGRVHVQKRLDRVLRAAATLRDRGHAADYAFLIVGDGPDESRLRGLARDLRLGEMVRFVGRVHRDDVRRYYSAADVALLTTARMEVGLPMAGLEALACGLPCVVPAGSLGSETLARVMRQVDPADPGLVAEALRDATRKRASRESLLPAQFTLAHCARGYLAAFEDLAPAARS
ncbi:glycosyltransferase family 4 protein [Rhizomonospora bruguierae]|uniref:glycosyltransferase family 4 protein n=1 Tax=Rhizomonospora bruguierae TaxID=1581705 RepID=UPI001BCD3A04|nr:glycosyltransferase family 4 protein [Micromonospora sp. NBRC 107566]